MSGILFIVRCMVKSADRRGELADVTSVLCRTYCLIKAQTVDEGVPAAEREYVDPWKQTLRQKFLL